MRLSLRKPEPDSHPEESQRLKSEVKSEVKSEFDKNDVDTAKLTFLLKEDVEFCRRSLR